MFGEGTFDAIRDKIANMEQSMNATIRTALQEPLISAQIMDYNVEQMNAGIDSLGTVLTPPYADFTIAMKKLKGQPYDHVTLRDEGDFQRGIFIQFEDDHFSLFSHDPKAAHLVDKYGYFIFGLTELHWLMMKDDIRDVLTDEVRHKHFH